MDILNRFLNYISIPTNSNSNSSTIPSTQTQYNLAKYLYEELKNMNMDDVYLDVDHCYVYAHLKGIDTAPKLGFISHLDTCEAVTDNNVNPQIIKNYNGESVKLNENEILDVNVYPHLKKHKGETLITTDGTTLLGSDDKAGIAEIMCMLETIINNNIKHGDIYIAFTSDEEIGKGTDYFDFSKFQADYAYTVDGYDCGEISYENFNAASVKINITGISAFLGAAKNVMVNSQLIANEIINLIPKEYPETAEGYEGYYHLSSITGNVTNTELLFLIRDFDYNSFEKRKSEICNIVNLLNKKYSNCISIEISDTYHNMKDKLSNHMHIIENAMQAIKNAGVTPLIQKIRGGTDGADLTEKGLICPNLGLGGNNYHSIFEYICLEDMQKVSEILVEIVKLYAK